MEQKYQKSIKITLPNSWKTSVPKFKNQNLHYWTLSKNAHKWTSRNTNTHMALMRAQQIFLKICLVKDKTPGGVKDCGF